MHEDVAIASYLLLLWEQDRRRTGRLSRQSFVDIGCGNGLLVSLQWRGWRGSSAGWGTETWIWAEGGVRGWVMGNGRCAR